MSNITENVLNKIKEEKISPKPKWYFTVKELEIFLLTFASVLLASLSFAIILNFIANHDGPIFRKRLHFLIEVLRSIPVIWVIIFILCIFLGCLIFKQKSDSYKYNSNKILFFSIFSCIALGILFFSLGIGEKVERVFDEEVPIYQSLREQRESAWVHPEKGYLAGTIRAIGENNTFVLEDFSGKYWAVETDKRIQLLVLNTTNHKVKMKGEMLSKNTFYAHDISLWNIKRKKIVEIIINNRERLYITN